MLVVQYIGGCERLSAYLIGLRFHIETDHKPLVPLFSTKQRLYEFPIRVQIFRLRMMWYDFSISHIAGKHLVTADTLSRAPSQQPTTDDHKLQQDIEQICQRQEADPVFQQLVQYTMEGWPEKKSLSKELRQYHKVRCELTVAEGILMRGSRVVIPIYLTAS